MYVIVTNCVRVRNGIVGSNWSNFSRSFSISLSGYYHGLCLLPFTRQL